MPDDVITLLRERLQAADATGEVPVELYQRAVRAVERIADAHAADPTLVRRDGRWRDLVEGMVRELAPLSRRAAQAREDRRAGRVLNPVMEEAAELLDLYRERFGACAAEVEALVWPDWDTPAGRLRFAGPVLPKARQQDK